MSSTWSRRGLPWKPKDDGDEGKLKEGAEPKNDGKDDGKDDAKAPEPKDDAKTPGTATPGVKRQPGQIFHTGRRWEPDPNNPAEVRLRRQMDEKWRREKVRRAKNREEAAKNLWVPTPKTKAKAMPKPAAETTGKTVKPVKPLPKPVAKEKKEKMEKEVEMLKEAEEWAKAETIAWLAEPSKSAEEQENKERLYLRMMLLNPDEILSGNLANGVESD